MRQKELREKEVVYCDFCGSETEHPEKCSICGKEGCGKDGYSAHFAFSGDIYIYEGDKRGHFRICKECAAKKPNANETYGDIINKLVSSG